MSYAPVHTAGRVNDGDDEDASTIYTKPFMGEQHVQHPYFKSSNALHTAISVAAGSVEPYFKSRKRADYTALDS